MSEEKIAKNDLIAYRSGVEDDKRFIYCTWLPSLYHGNDWFNQIPEPLYTEKYTHILDYIFKRGAQVNICCLRDQPDVILAYSITEGHILHFIYCKQSWRGLSISKKLMPENLKEVSHLTYIGSTILKKKYPNIIFNPFLN